MDADLCFRSSVEHYLPEGRRDWARKKRAPSPLISVRPPPRHFFLYCAVHHRSRDSTVCFPLASLTTYNRVVLLSPQEKVSTTYLPRVHRRTVLARNAPNLFAPPHRTFPWTALPYSNTAGDSAGKLFLSPHRRLQLSEHCFYPHLQRLIFTSQPPPPRRIPLGAFLFRRPLCALDTPLDFPRRRCPWLRPTTAKPTHPEQVYSALFDMRPWARRACHTTALLRTTCGCHPSVPCSV